MSPDAQLEILKEEAERLAEPQNGSAETQALQAVASGLAQQLVWLPNTSTSGVLPERCQTVRKALVPAITRLESNSRRVPVSDDVRWLSENVPLLFSELQGLPKAFKRLQRVPHARTPAGDVVPRIVALAEGYLTAVSSQFSESGFTLFLEAFQQHTVLEFQELQGLIPALKLALLEQIADRAWKAIRGPEVQTCNVGVCVQSLREISQTSWKDVLEPLVAFDRVLRQDPAGAYAEMDFDSREFYRKKLANIAKYSDLSEMQVARHALALAQAARQRVYDNPRVALRESHIGYYLLDEGTTFLYERVGFKPPYSQRVQMFLRKHPDEFFLPGIEVLTSCIMLAVVFLITAPYTSLSLLTLTLLLLLLPSSQSAVQLMNYLTTAILPAEILPKLNFTEGIPEDCLTLVAVPSLLLNEKQVRGLVEDLEVRFLGNHDRNLHFALLTDLPDSREPAREDNPLIDLCADLIRELNEKYSGKQMGSFLLFHRHRVYNPRERAWMGWERKRGKLLDLNKLLRSQYDSFPVKVGELSILPQVRFVITLDSDTELPRQSARRMIGCMAHPLNQAIVDPKNNIVVSGYGILQPRVGVSVHSTARSRLAAIYAGESGFDIYTRAVSDAYQDLYREGSFTGKGVYEVDTVHRVLDRRFPRNALLSHDLIEGAYARAGLASDIEVIEDYPSHYSAYNRRKHRWLRGDWQITAWLLTRVPNEMGARVSNPISLISRWKILDNLRRSLVEPATFLLLIFGWLVFSGSPVYWTLATIFILFIPTWFQLGFNLVRAVVERNSSLARESWSSFLTANVNVFLSLTFLAHQTLLSLDAVARALVRRLITRQRLLEWETAAEAEFGNRARTPIDTYLNWTPVVALVLGLLVALWRPRALPAALPILVLWASNKLVSAWLNSSPVAPRSEISKKDTLFLRGSALRTWRYFASYCTEENNWLLPDNVQEQPAAVAERISPTNLGLLLNARQVACELGYLTVPEFIDWTAKTLATVTQISKHRGHLLNWYDTRTLQPLTPLFVSSVDSGNLLASLITLQQGCLDRLNQPLLQPSLTEGLLDHLRTLRELRAVSRKNLSHGEWELKTNDWLQSLQTFAGGEFEAAKAAPKAKNADDVRWFAESGKLRLAAVRQTVRSYVPWFLPEFVGLRNDPAVGAELMDHAPLSRLPEFLGRVDQRLGKALLTAASPEKKELYRSLLGLLPDARANTTRLLDGLRALIAQTGTMIDEMDFAFLLSRRRKLMSVGYDVEAKQLQNACYDLLATESRTAIFTAVAKDDIPQESWFLLGRGHTLDEGRPILMSWSGTMFEYLMPALWMRSYSNTLLERSRAAVVRSQIAYALSKHVPWGISESAFAKLDDTGNYQYRAFGIPSLALQKSEAEALVISPYSTFLALNIDPTEALRNLHRMADMGWLGAYGFYEAADFTPARNRFWQPRYQLVKCWMAHHQGMSLLSMANFLDDNIVQRWFHSDRRVQATELLLHEKPVAYVERKDIPRRFAAA